MGRVAGGARGSQLTQACLRGAWTAFGGGGPLADSSSQIVATHLARFLWLDHAFSCLGQGALASQGR